MNEERVPQPSPLGDGDPLVRVTLVPVYHFGADSEECPNCGTDVETGYGLMDAVENWSDCNQAIGHIYRVDDAGSERYRRPGDTITIYVPQSEMAKFDRSTGVDGYLCPACHVPYAELPATHVLSRPACNHDR